MILERVIGKHPQADRILVAKISGEAKHHATWRELTADEEAAAVAALRELAGGRADLLAEVCGVMEGASEGDLHEPLARQAAELCRKAGVGPEAIPRWIAEGPRRRDAAEAGQQRLDRYMQRRDEYLRKLAHLAPPLSEEQKAKLALLLAPGQPWSCSQVSARPAGWSPRWGPGR